MTYYGKTVFTDVIKNLEMRLSWTRVALNLMTSVPTRDRGRETGSRAGHVVTEAETAVSGHQPPKRAGRPPRRGDAARPHPAFRLPASTAVRE